MLTKKTRNIQYFLSPEKTRLHAKISHLHTPDHEHNQQLLKGSNQRHQRKQNLRHAASQSNYIYHHHLSAKKYNYLVPDKEKTQF